MKVVITLVYMIFRSVQHLPLSTLTGKVHQFLVSNLERERLDLYVVKIEISELQCSDVRYKVVDGYLKFFNDYTLYRVSLKSSLEFLLSKIGAPSIFKVSVLIFLVPGSNFEHTVLLYNRSINKVHLTFAGIYFHSRNFTKIQNF